MSGSLPVWRRVGAVAAGGVLAAHAVPVLSSFGPLRAALLSRLNGCGAPGGIALTFDDGPDPFGTPAILQALDVLGWTATFFLLGSQVARHPDVARSVAAAGHEIAVHGDQHRNHLTRTPRDVLSDVRRARTLIADVTGTSPRWFRPPYGVLAAASVAAARSAGLTPVLWSAWGRDWTGAGAEQIAATVLRKLDDRGTVLLHDSDCTSRPNSWRGTVACLPLLATHLRGHNLQVRTLTEHMGA